MLMNGLKHRSRKTFWAGQGNAKAHPALMLAVSSLALVLLLQPASASATVLPATITENMTLSALGSPYTGTSTIAAGVTVQAGPGTVFKVGKLTVKGTLEAKGSAEKPVVFTGSKGASTGEWESIKFEPGSGGSVLDHVEVGFGGFIQNMAMIEINASSPTITNSTVRKARYEGISVVNGGSPRIANNLFLENGVAYTRPAIKYAASPEKPGEVNIEGNTIKSGGAGISVSNTSTAGSGGTLSGNLIENNLGGGLSYNGADIPGNITENTLVGNGFNKLEVGGTVAHSSTWTDGGVAISLSPELTVASGVTLRVNPGVVMLPKKIVVKGTLKAEGTAVAPITFTGANGKASGEWSNIKFEPGSGASVLDHVVIAFGGSALNTGMIEVNSSSPTITNSTIRSSKYEGIAIPHGGSPKITGNLFPEDGVSFSRAAIKYTATPAEPGEVNVQSNVIENGGAGISVSNTSTAGSGGTLSGNIIVGNVGGGLSYSGVDVPGNITENTLVGNGFNKLEVGGTVAHSSTWNNGGVPVAISPDLTIASGVTLKISAGVVLLPSKIFVKGALRAEGTDKETVRFTGKNEAAAGEWSYMRFEPGSDESLLDHAEVAYGGAVSGGGMIEVKGASPVIRNSTIRKSQNYGIKVTESGAPQVEWDRFRANANGLSYTGTGMLSAPNNDWGCASGPQPAGCGDSVTSNVSWKPPAELAEFDGPCRGKEAQCGEGADPVTLATGHLDYSHRDLLLGNKGAVPLEFTRTYNSGSTADTGLGVGWSQTGLITVSELASGDALVVRQDGRQDLFQKTESGYKAPSGVTDTLARLEGTFQLTSLEGTVYRFDSSGRIASVTDDHGLKTTYGYDANGGLATITDPSAQTLTFSYNASNHITLVKDSTGREVRFAYSAAGDLESVTDALGGITKYAYDSQHHLTQITDPRGNVILKNVYDSQGRITEQRDGLENLWKLEYKAGETIVTEPRGGKLAYGFDSQNRVVSETDQLGHTTTTSYDTAGNVSKAIMPGGAEWSFGHDAAGNLTSVEDPEGGERSFEYDSKNRLTHSTDARGGSWTYEWSAANDLTKITDPEGGETSFTYNASGQPLTRTDPTKHKTEFSWDARGNQLSATDPLGHKTSLEYNARNYLTAKTLPGLKAETLEVDALGDVLARTTLEGHKTKYAYDANGLPIQVTDPAEGVWKIERNAMERPTVYTDPLGQLTKVAYNGNLRPTKVTNRRGKETTYAYDLANRLTEVGRPEGGIWKYGYDARGNRTRTLEPRGNETTYAYDLLDRMTEAKEPLSVTTKYGYDANGDLTSLTDPRGNATSFVYDKLGRLTEIAQPLEKATTYTYDSAGNQLTKATAVATLKYDYDAADRLSSISSGGSTLRSYGYDAADRRTSATDAEGHKIEIGYTEEGRPSSIKDGRGQSVTRSYDSRGNLVKQVDGRGTLEYGYDKLNRMISLTDPQGKALGFAYDPEGDLTEVTRPNGLTTTNLYNEAGRLAETTSKTLEPPSVLESLKYSYDASGNVTSRMDQRLETEAGYAYDSLNRLTEFDPPGEGATTYGYDAAGNRTEAGGITYAFNALNQPTEASTGTSYSYDAAGRLTGEVNGSEETTFAWDPFDHLAKVEGSNGSVTYAFDGLERLSERKEGEAPRIFHYGDLGDMATYETNGEGKTTTSYLQGPSGLVEQRSGEATAFPLVDGHGDVTAITSGTAEVESRLSFDPWGNQLSGPNLEMGYLGAWGRRSDPASGLIQMGVRSYDPALGSFVSEDPVLGHLGIGVSSNRYPYVWDNPVNRYDLEGRDVELPGAPICVLGCSPEEPQELTDRAHDFWKHVRGPLSDIYNFAGNHWQGCVEGAGAGAATGATLGAPAGPPGSAAGARTGAFVGCFDTVQAEILLEIASS
jgi:RHS repeat-associated protein